MPDITYAFNPEQFNEGNSFRYSQEASTLGLKPGEWPHTFTVTGDFGNGQPFVLATIHGNGNRLYTQAAGCVRILIFND